MGGVGVSWPHCDFWGECTLFCHPFYVFCLAWVTGPHLALQQGSSSFLADLPNPTMNRGAPQAAACFSAWPAASPEQEEQKADLLAALGEFQNWLGWERPSRSPSPTTSLAHRVSPLNHVPWCHVHASLERLQGSGCTSSWCSALALLPPLCCAAN